jgi:ElaB/YqjD/DUF883 family membrane-anchored ribosome-binding protein
VTERTTASSSSAWDADVLPTATDDGSDGAADGDREIEVLVAEIEQTRSEMTGTVEELGDRLDPKTIADRTTEKVREATIGKVESKVDDMTNAASTLASNAGETVQQTGSGVIETIKRNPVPAALAGFGLGWLVLNRQSGRTSSSEWSRSGAAWTGQTDRRGFSDSNLGGGVNPAEKIDEVTGKAKRTAQDVASTVGETASEAATTVKSSASSVATTAQSALESNPLAVGAIALAVGTAVGLALPASQAEKRVMGQAGSQLIDKAETAVTKPLEEMQRTTER